MKKGWLVFLAVMLLTLSVCFAACSENPAEGGDTDGSQSLLDSVSDSVSGGEDDDADASGSESNSESESESESEEKKIPWGEPGWID